MNISCSNCRYVPLNPSETLFQIEGRCLCLKCYQEVYSCPGCRKIVSNEYLPIGNSKWHTACYNRSSYVAQPAVTVRSAFACARCSTTNSPVFYEIQGLKYCQQCCDLFPMCNGCGIKITDSYIPFNGGKYHQSCYNSLSKILCCNNCKVPFGTQPYMNVDGKNLCQRCAQSVYSCAKCSTGIMGEFVVFEGQKFHPHCKIFYCPGCKSGILGEHILVKGERWHEVCYNNITRQNSYNSTMGRIVDNRPTDYICSYCRERIYGEYVLIGSQHRHPHCFGPKDGGLHRLK
eukprot:TRINITY_DN4673_c0_g1_i1.p1 TRINITY_DN4673_c0_g1~~TRINITY_DN4673_c0_g1_i1.p1  ORF type:complete len:298 (-),score=43.86 TRINITY_DN4673_c0_g1_i1:96-962(-)